MDKINTNFVVIEGHVKTFLVSGKSQIAICVVSIGDDNDRYNIDVRIMGKLKDVAEKYLSMGSHVLISGALTSDYVDAKEIKLLGV